MQWISRCLLALRFASLLAIALALAACVPAVSVPPPTPQEEAEARTFEPARGHALIYVYMRPARVYPVSGATLFVRAAPAKAGEPEPPAQRVRLDENSYVVADVPAGAVHLTVVMTVNSPRGIDTGSDNRIVRAVARMKYYVEAWSSPPLLVGPVRADPHLLTRSAQDAAEPLAKAKLVGVVRFGGGPERSTKG